LNRRAKEEERRKELDKVREEYKAKFAEDSVRFSCSCTSVLIMTDIEVRKSRLTYKAKLRRWQDLRKFFCSDVVPLFILISLQPSGEKSGSGRNEERRGESTSSRCNQTIMWTVQRKRGRCE